MPDSARDYLYALLLAVGIIAALVGGVLLRAAITLDQHIGSAIVLGIGAIFLFGAYRLKPQELKRDLESFGKVQAKGQPGEGGKRDT
jgi:hypothetical protein